MYDDCVCSSEILRRGADTLCLQITWASSAGFNIAHQSVSSRYHFQIIAVLIEPHGKLFYCHD